MAKASKKAKKAKKAMKKANRALKRLGIAAKRYVLTMYASSSRRGKKKPKTGSR